MKKILLLSALCLFITTPAYSQDPEVTRAVFATGVENREPIEIITEFFATTGGTVYFFSELMNMEGQRFYHVWNKNGEEVYRFGGVAGSARWRTHSSMKVEHFKADDVVGVDVVGADGETYRSASMHIR